MRTAHQRSFRGGAGPTDGERWIEAQVKGNLAAVLANVPVSEHHQSAHSHVKGLVSHTHSVGDHALMAVCPA